MVAGKSNSSAHMKVSRRSFLVGLLPGTITLLGIPLVGCNFFSSTNPKDNLETKAPTEERPTPKPPVEEASPQPPSEEEALESRIDGILAGMSLEHKVAQMLIVRPEVLTGVSVATLATEVTHNALKNCPVGGVSYFGQNLLNADQTTAMLSNTLKYGIQVNGIPPFLCVDEEGGTVSRIGGNPGFAISNAGNMSDIGATHSVATAKNTARYIANYLKPLGFNVDFAPVCDIANNPDSAMILRSFGSDPNMVAQMARAQVEGFSESGMLCAAKHFPGIGSVTGDSHTDTIVSNQSLEALRALEFIPFKTVIDAKIPFIMVGHMSLPAVTGDNTPASLSPKIVQSLLREELGYEGLIITDSLGMGAVAAYHSVGESVVLALQAGCDIALMPPELESALQAVYAALNNGTLAQTRIEQSVRRILRTKIKFMGDLFTTSS